MATLTPVTPTLAGTVAAGAAASGGGDKFTNPKGNALLRITNGSGSSINVTLAAGVAATRPADNTYPAMTLSANVVAVAAGTTKVVGPIPPAFNDGNGDVLLSYSDVTSLNVLVIQP